MARDERIAREVTALSGFSLARFPAGAIWGPHSRARSVRRAECPRGRSLGAEPHEVVVRGPSDPTGAPSDRGSQLRPVL